LRQENEFYKQKEMIVTWYEEKLQKMADKKNKYKQELQELKRLLPSDEKSIEIFVKNLTGEHFPVFVKPSDTCEQIGREIYSKTNIYPGTYKMILGSR